MINQLILGDNLEVLRKMDSDSVDLIYLDPPFFSNRNYEVIWGDEGEVGFRYRVLQLGLRLQGGYGAFQGGGFAR